MRPNVMRAALCAALTVGLATMAVRAHHSFTMFDGAREEVLAGEVARWAFNAPHVLMYIRDAKGTIWGFEGAAPATVVSRTPRVDGLTFKTGDQVTVIYCPLRDGRSGGAIGLVVTRDGAWYNPADGPCRPDEANWRNWLAGGYISRAQAEAAAKR